jgi:hypothetical protein
VVDLSWVYAWTWRRFGWDNHLCRIPRRLVPLEQTPAASRVIVLPDPDCMLDKRLLVSLTSDSFLGHQWSSTVVHTYDVECWIGTPALRPLRIMVYRQARFHMTSASINAAMDAVNKLQTARDWSVTLNEIRDCCDWWDGLISLDVPGNGQPAEIG